MATVNLNRGRVPTANIQPVIDRSGEILGDAIGRLAATVGGESARIADTLIREKAQAETIRASAFLQKERNRIFEETRQETSDRDFDRFGELVTERMERAFEEAGGMVRTGLGKRQFDEFLQTFRSDVESAALSEAARMEVRSTRADTEDAVVDVRQLAEDAESVLEVTRQQKRIYDQNANSFSAEEIQARKQAAGEQTFAEWTSTAMRKNPVAHADELREILGNEDLLAAYEQEGILEGQIRRSLAAAQNQAGIELRSDTILRLQRGDMNPEDPRNNLPDIERTLDAWDSALEFRAELGDLNIDNFINLRGAIGQVRQQIQAVRTVIDTLESGGGLTPGDPVHETGLNVLTRRVLNMDVPAQVKQRELVGLASQAGVMPDVLVDEVSSGLRSPNLQRQAESFELLERIDIATDGRALESLRRDSSMGNFRQTLAIYESIKAGNIGDPQAAAERANIASFARGTPEYQANVEAFDKRLTVNTGDDEVSWVQQSFNSKFNSKFDNFLRVGFRFAPSQRNTMKAQYERILRDYVGMLGTDEGQLNAAAEAAFNEVASQWGQSEFAMPTTGEAPLLFDGSVASAIRRFVDPEAEPVRAGDAWFFPPAAAIGNLKELATERSVTQRPIEREMSGLATPDEIREEMALTLQEELPPDLLEKLDIDRNPVTGAVSEIFLDGSRVYLRYEDRVSKVAGRPVYSFIRDDKSGIGEMIRIRGNDEGKQWLQFVVPQSKDEMLLWEKLGREQIENQRETIKRYRERLIEQVRREREGRPGETIGGVTAGGRR